MRMVGGINRAHCRLRRPALASAFVGAGRVPTVNDNAPAERLLAGASSSPYALNCRAIDRHLANADEWTLAPNVCLGISTRSMLIPP